MRLELGINTCFAVKRWPRPDDWAPIVRNRLGLTLVQHSLDLVDLSTSNDSTSRTLRETAAAAGLEIHSTFTGLAAYSSNLLLAPDADARAEARRWFETVIAFSTAVGARATGGHVGAFAVADWLDAGPRASLWAGLRASLASLAAGARTEGLEYLVVENLASAREPSTMAQIDDLLTDGDDRHVPIRLCLDLGHMCVPGTHGEDRDPYAWLRRFGLRAPIVQLQQSDAAGDHHWPFTPERNREGRIDADRVIDALGESGADEVALIIEVIPPFEQDDEAVLEDLARSVEYWRDALERRGFGTAG
jgi:D-erythrulose 1-phosphate 3-epimerase